MTRRLLLLLVLTVAFTACKLKEEPVPDDIPAPTDVAAPPADAVRTASGLASIVGTTRLQE